jgi:hypothetical protein
VAYNDLLRLLHIVKDAVDIVGGEGRHEPELRFPLLDVGRAVVEYEYGTADRERQPDGQPPSDEGTARTPRAARNGRPPA